MKRHAITKKTCQGLKQQLMNFSFIFFLAYTPYSPPPLLDIYERNHTRLECSIIIIRKKISSLSLSLVFLYRKHVIGQIESRGVRKENQARRRERERQTAFVTPSCL
jgi:hypothetical protein